jgi:hypothetical protein
MQRFPGFSTEANDGDQCPKELAALQRMSVSQLRERYAEAFGEATTTGNRTWLIRRIA